MIFWRDVLIRLDFNNTIYLKPVQVDGPLYETSSSSWTQNLIKPIALFL